MAIQIAEKTQKKLLLVKEKLGETSSQTKIFWPVLSSCSKNDVFVAMMSLGPKCPAIVMDKKAKDFKLTNQLDHYERTALWKKKVRCHFPKLSVVPNETLQDPGTHWRK